MLLGEPPRTAYDLNFSLFGIPVRVHPLFWLICLLLGWQSDDVASVAIWVIAVFLSILVHELGHALMMRFYGFRPWITLYGLGGMAAYDQGYGFHSSEPGTLGQILICLAGPFAGFSLAAVLIAGLILGDLANIEPGARVIQFLFTMLSICIIWGVVNLLPIYPLDGGQIAREILLKLSPYQGIRWSLLLSLFTAVMMVAVGIALWQLFVALLFGYLAYMSFATLQAYSGRGPW